MSIRILVVGPAWVGDMVLAQSLFIALKDRLPDCELDVLAPAWSLPLLERMPEVRRAVTQEVGHGRLGLLSRYRLGRELRSQRYDWAIVLPRSFKSAIVPWVARIPKRTGYRGEMRYGVLNDPRPLRESELPQMAQRYVMLGLPAGAPMPPPVPRPKLTVRPENRRQLLDRLGLTLDRPVVAFMPGAAYGPAKRWPAEYFSELAKAWIGKGCRVWIFGSRDDAEVGERIRAGAGEGVHDLCGATRLEDVIDLLPLATCVLTNDSGLMHVAAAVSSRIFAIYGSSSPRYTPPLSDTATILYENLSCSPCFERVCPLGHTDCLRKIVPERVLESMERPPV